MNTTKKGMTKTNYDKLTRACEEIERISMEKLFRLCAFQAAAAARKRSERLSGCRGHFGGWAGRPLHRPQMLEWVALTGCTNSPPGAAFKAAADAWAMSGITRP